MAQKPSVGETIRGARVAVEGQPALRDALVGVGGEVAMRVLRLEGTLPPVT